MRLRNRPAVVLFALLAAAATLVSAPIAAPRYATPAAAMAEPDAARSGPDYATTTFQDPWDFNNPADIVLDARGPAYGLHSPRISSGMLSFNMSGRAYISPLWAGFKGSLHLGREGARPANQLNADVYTHLRIHAYASTATSVQLHWFTCIMTATYCKGGVPFKLGPGWQTIDMPIAGGPHILGNDKPWRGKMQGIQLEFFTKYPTAIKVDDIRIYKRSLLPSISWASPNNLSAQLWWANPGTTPSGTRNRDTSTVPDATSSGPNNVVTTRVTGYPSGTQFWAVAANGTKALVGKTLRAPLPIIDTPSAAGCRGFLWTFPSPRYLAGYGNLTRMSFSPGGTVSATNAGPQPGDPWIRVPLPATGFDGRRYHRLTITESYDGPFNLGYTAGGGTMARVLWKLAGHTAAYSQTNDIITYSGKRTIRLDMGLPAATLTEPEGTAAMRLPFASRYRVVALRWDPNEDVGARRWRVHSVRLAADCSFATSFWMKWHDASYVAGSVAKIYAISAGGRTFSLGTVKQGSGTNSFLIRASKLPPSRYSIRMTVTTPYGAATSVAASGPLIRR